MAGTKQRWTTAGLTALACAAAFGALGCRGERTEAPPRELLPDMDVQPKWRPQSESEFFADHRTMRPPVVGAVAFGDSVDPDDPDRADYLRENTEFYEGLDSNGKPVEWMPVQVTQELIDRGHERFDIYCSVCHNFNGDGKGTVGVRWSYALPNYHDEKYIDRSLDTGSDGHIFNVIRHGVKDAQGVQKMPAYGYVVHPADAWAIVAYIRVLQASQTADASMAPAALRQELERRNAGVPTPMQGAAGSGSTSTSKESPE